MLPYFTKHPIDNPSTVKPPLWLFWLSYTSLLVLTHIPQWYLKPGSLLCSWPFVSREAAVGCACPRALWTLWPTAPLSSFISVSLAWGDRKPERPKSLLLLFHISLLVTGLTSPQGTRGTERGWDEKKGEGKRGVSGKKKKKAPRGEKKTDVQ